MFTFNATVHAKDKNGDGFNLELYPDREHDYGFFLQSPPSGGIRALVSKSVADQLEVGQLVEVTIKPGEKLAERKDVNASTGNSSAGDGTDGGTGVADVATDRPRRGRTG